MEYRKGQNLFLHVKLARDSFLSREKLQALNPLFLFEDHEKFILVFPANDIDDVLKRLSFAFPQADILETGLFPTEKPVSGYRLAYTDELSIVSPGEGVEPKPGELVIKSDLSFGSGFHPTTSLCVELLASTLREKQAMKIFDLGTGSGILALCAAKLGARAVLAADIDYRATVEARQNVLANGYEAQILVVHGSYDCARPGFFDLVLANLTISTILTIGKALPPLLKPGGSLILSGFTAGQIEEVMNLFPEGRLAAQKVKEGWAALKVNFL
ncbi:methyltransferase small [Thermodesulfatator indicus DSM 15286]|uniref:Methyltransferase small n=1 Tax=Thermodesulfatator indicus (strain DSM 15286 / JCM 11887 / CIR29812) TaxID=667014 RepID=F8AAY2_THEID|nr:50S ribosomal protein L11 methyltransferase [Thermodesulfatator indicus]AEH45501.1 methyltransferase small [Thermodesulfatator indicus DSM 15286]